jgi:hypothetical protein
LAGIGNGTPGTTASSSDQPSAASFAKPTFFLVFSATKSGTLQLRRVG